MKQINPDNRVVKQELGVRSLEFGVWRDAINRVCTGVWRDAINRVCTGVWSEQLGVSIYSPLCPMPNAPCPMPNAQYFSTRGCANGFSTRRYANAQYKCPMPNAHLPKESI